MDAELSDISRSRSTSPHEESSEESSGDIQIQTVGRRRGRGRGRGGNNCANRDQLAVQAREDRNNQVEERIENLSEQELRTIMTNACRRQPSFAFNLLEQMSARGEEPSPPVAAPALSAERCQKVKKCVARKIRRGVTHGFRLSLLEVYLCFLTISKDFYNIVLDELVLEVAARTRNDMLARPADQDYNRGRRHTAYRQYIVWRHGYLGAGNRCVVPSCCVWKIETNIPTHLANTLDLFLAD